MIHQDIIIDSMSQYIILCKTAAATLANLHLTPRHTPESSNLLKPSERPQRKTFYKTL